MKDDSELINELLEKNSSEALEELSLRHSGVFIEVINRYKECITSAQAMDLRDSKDFYIYEAARKYDETLSKFPTYLGQTAKYLCLNQMNKNRKMSSVSFDDVEFAEADKAQTPDDFLSNHEILKNVLDVLNDHPDERVKLIFKERYFNSDKKSVKSWGNVAKIVGLSVQGCINLHNSVIKELQKSCLG